MELRTNVKTYLFSNSAVERSKVKDYSRNIFVYDTDLSSLRPVQIDIITWIRFGEVAVVMISCRVGEF